MEYVKGTAEELEGWGGLGLAVAASTISGHQCTSGVGLGCAACLDTRQGLDCLVVFLELQANNEYEAHAGGGTGGALVLVRHAPLEKRRFNRVCTSIS